MIQRIFGLFFTLLLISSTAWAQQKGAVELITKAEVDVTTTNGQGVKEVKRVEASKANVVPGDKVIYTITYKNNGAKPATAVVVKDPVPEHMVYIEGSAAGEGAKIEFSIDHGKTYGPAGGLTVADAQGKKRKAVAADYTHIRWTIAKVAPGGKGSVTFNAKVK